MTTHAITEFQIATDDELMAANGSGLGAVVARRVIPAVLPRPKVTIPVPQPNPGDAEPQQNESCGDCPNWSVTFTKY